MQRTQPNPPPPQVYLSALRDPPSGDGDDALWRKRAAFTDGRLHQVQEPRKLSHVTHFTFPSPDLIITAPKPPRKQLLTRADLSQFDFARRADQPRVQISTESPFAQSTVPTPPQGFSLRRVEPVRKQAATALRQMQPHENRVKSSIMLRYPDAPTRVRLGEESELVYPDGHRSPLPSPRND
jgi:hypothetical protein